MENMSTDVCCEAFQKVFADELLKKVTVSG